MKTILEQINEANDIKSVDSDLLPELAREIRQFLVTQVAQTGGHLASNLGAVELTMALHLVLDLPKDKIIWDVGHQSYTHKILTGRREEFAHLRQLGGISGFPKRTESPCDCFDTGHSSTSISAGLGFATARDLQGQDYTVVSVIGDGALTGGLAYEALNNAADLKTNFIIVLNDNKMSISKNVGGLSRHLASLRTAEAYQGIKDGIHQTLDLIPFGDRVARRMQRSKSSLKQLLIPGMIFENMGITYLGPVDGHDIRGMIRILTEAKRVNGAVIVHVLTDKGKGYGPAEARPDRFHGTGPFAVETGKPLKEKQKPDYTDVFSQVICRLAEKNPRVVAMTAAMTDGTGLRKFQALYPERFFDVGIAEGHAVTFCSGLAAAGLHPFFAVYSSFLQRGFDELIHDVCIQHLPVTFCIDRAGLVGADGETHQGITDLSYLALMPNMTVLAPKNRWELKDMLRFCAGYEVGPTAIRYPRGSAWDGLKAHRAPIVYGKSEWIYRESQVAIFAVGNMVEIALDVRAALHQAGFGCSVINARFVKPVDAEAIAEAVAGHDFIITMEENMLHGGFGDSVGGCMDEQKLSGKRLHFGIRDQYVPHGTVSQLQRLVGIDADTVAAEILQALSEEEILPGWPLEALPKEASDSRE